MTGARAADTVQQGRPEAAPPGICMPDTSLNPLPPGEIPSERALNTCHANLGGFRKDPVPVPFTSAA
ncbi:hypothetical protein GCM10010344_52360 [Streptomyces bluensis]|nr:hypothetical protein GCM10010344_52360 [Streptomyces bluensis]